MILADLNSGLLMDGKKSGWWVSQKGGKKKWYIRSRVKPTCHLGSLTPETPNAQLTTVHIKRTL